jgi:phosphate:Na+ symporter
MTSFLALSKMLAGIGIFLMGMNFMEDALRRLAGRPFKVFLRKQTKSKYKGIFGGAVVSGVLQSSSIVNLMVLAFVGAGIITMGNALAIILGANIGTTFNSWIVATLGFAFNIEFFALPLVGIAGLTMAGFAKGTKAHDWSRMSFGFGAVFLGLEFMKVSFGEIASQLDFSVIHDYPAIAFVLAGFIVTSIVQSSSATMAITLSALHVNAISLYSATAIVLGAEVGTTIKLLIASFNGVPAKKRVALGNFIFNTISIIAILIALRPINLLFVNFTDPLIALVSFQTFINILGVLVFFPFLNMFEKFLENRFTDDLSGARYLKLVPQHEGDLSLEAFDKEAKRFLWLTLDFHRNAFGVAERKHHDEKTFHTRSYQEKYDYLKLLHGEIHSYYIGMNKELLNAQERERADQLISSVRNSMFSAKSTKDSHYDIEQFKNSSSNAKFQFYLDTKKKVEEFDHDMAESLNRSSAGTLFEEIVALYNRVQKGYADELQRLYRHEANSHLTEIDISTLINFNREFFACYKAMVWAVKDYLLEKSQAAYFAELPGFIR